MKNRDQKKKRKRKKKKQGRKNPHALERKAQCLCLIRYVIKCHEVIFLPHRFIARGKWEVCRVQAIKTPFIEIIP